MVSRLDKNVLFCAQVLNEMSVELVLEKEVADHVSAISYIINTLCSISTTLNTACHAHIASHTHTGHITSHICYVASVCVTCYVASVCVTCYVASVCVTCYVASQCVCDLLPIS